jgi:hypothetical protein
MTLCTNHTISLVQVRILIKLYQAFNALKPCLFEVFCEKCEWRKMFGQIFNYGCCKASPSHHQWRYVPPRVGLPP